MAFGPQTIFEWFPENPETLRHFQDLMSTQREGHSTWLDFYPFQEQIVDGYDKDPNGVLLIDVGGNVGQELLDIQKYHKNLPGRLVLQDLPMTVEKVPATSAFEAMSHDFFNAQPIIGMLQQNHIGVLVLTLNRRSRVLSSLRIA